VSHGIAYVPAATTATPSSRTRTMAAKVPVAFIAATIKSPDVTPLADAVTVTTSLG